MKLKMNKSKSHGNAKGKVNGLMTKSMSLPLSEILVKEERECLSDEELNHLERASPTLFKVEVDEDDSFSGAVLTAFRSGSPLHRYSNSASSCSEQSSHSPSPSPPLMSQPQNRTRGLPPLSTVSVLNKASQPSIILSGLPQSSKAGPSPGAPLQHIVFINSCPYQLVPHNLNDSVQQGPQPIQLRVLPHAQQSTPAQPGSAPQGGLEPQPKLKANSSHRRGSHGPCQEEPSSEDPVPSHAHTLVENGDEESPTKGGVTDPKGISSIDFASPTGRESMDPQNRDGVVEMGTPSGAGYPIVKGDCPIPNLLNDSGPYGFKVHLDAKEDTLKTPTWLVSTITNKLYTNMNKPIPFRVVLKKAPQKRRFHLRAMAVFKYPMFLRQNVVRCPNHLNPLDSTNIDFLHPNHVIRADHPRAMYQTTPSGRLSVVIPLDFPEHRLEAIPVLLKFMCHNSCVGGINRRPMAVLLTLEHNESELGRYTVDVRVCACPSRDVKTEERQLIAKGLCSSRAGHHHAFESRRNRKRPRKEDESPSFEDDSIYYLPVRGATLFNFLQDTKLHYLKHHPDYAAKYPDPPIDLSLKMLEELQPASSELPLEEGPNPDSPPPGPASPLFQKDQEQQQPLLVLYAPESAPERPSADPGVPTQAPRVRIKAEKDSDPEDAAFRGESPLKSWRKKRSPRRDYSGRGALNGRHSRVAKGASAPGSPQGVPRSHLQVAPMPEKGSAGLIRILPKATPQDEGDGGGSKLQLALEAINETDKVMLAAQVLASHLGAHQLDK